VDAFEKQFHRHNGELVNLTSLLTTGRGLRKYDEYDLQRLLNRLAVIIPHLSFSTRDLYRVEFLHGVTDGDVNRFFTSIAQQRGQAIP
jgi:hypothetical protein